MGFNVKCESGVWVLESRPDVSLDDIVCDPKPTGKRKCVNSDVIVFKL